MADEVAKTALVFDATGAKKGAEEFAAAGQKIISTDDAVEKSAKETAAAVEAAETRKTTARRKGASDAKSVVDGETNVLVAATKRQVDAGADITRFLERTAQKYDPFGQAVRRAANELSRLEGIAASGGPQAARAADLIATAQTRLKSAEDALSQSRQQAGNIQNQQQAQASAGYDRILGVARQLVPVLSAVYAVNKLREMVGGIAQAGSEWELMASRAGAAGVSMGQVYAIAQKTGSALDATITSVSRLGMAAKDFGATGADIARVTQTVQQLGRVGGASAQELAAGTTQLAQALASGRLGGDELRSILENMPAVARQIADGLGVSVGHLRDMGAAGQLTAERVFGALLAGSDNADKAFARLPATLEQAGQRASTAWTAFAASLDKTLGLSRTLAGVLDGVAEMLEAATPQAATQQMPRLNAELQSLRQQLADAKDILSQGVGSEMGQPVSAGQVALLEKQVETVQELALQEQRLFAQRTVAEREAAAVTAANKKMNDGLGEMHKALGLVANDGKLMTAEQVSLERASAAVEEAIRRGGDALKMYGGSADTARAMLQRMREQVDPLAAALRNLSNEAALLATPSGLARDIATIQQQVEQKRGLPLNDFEAGSLVLGVRDRNAAQTGSAAEEAERAARAQQQLAQAAGRGSAAMREAERVNRLVAEGYKNGLTPEQEKTLRQTGKIPAMADGAAVSMRRLDTALRMENAAKGAQEAREFGSGASAAARGAMILAEAAGLGEAAQRRAAAAAAALTEKNFSGAEAARQRALEEAKVVEITNETVRGLERSTAENTAMTAAITQGAAAVEAETRAQYERATALKLGADRTGELARVMKAYDADREAAKGRQSADEAVKLQQQAQAVLALAAATGQGSEALAEAAVQNDLLTRARAKGVDTVDEFIAKYPKEAQAVRDLAAANKELAVQQALSGQRQDITLLRAELSLVNQLPEIRTRELALLRAKLDIENRFPGITREQRDEMLQNAQVIADINDQLRVQNEIRDAAKGIAGDVSQFLVDGFVNVENKGKSVFANLWEGAVAGGKRFLAKIAALFLEQKLILPIAMSVVGSVPGLFGIRSAAGGTDSLAGGSGSGDILSNLFGGARSASSIGSSSNWLTGGGAWLDGIFGTGGVVATNTAELAAATGALEFTGSAVAESMAVGAGLFEGAAASLASALPYIGIAVAVIGIASSLFKKKPSNKGAEYSFNLDEGFSTQFEGTKHPDQMALVKSFAEPIQTLIGTLENKYGVARATDATIGTNFGLKEGSSFFYDKGARDGGIENRQVFSFDPEDQSSIQAALDQLTVAFLKDADWSGIGTRIGAQAAADVATALENSAATTLDELLADISFAENFQSFVDLAAEDLDPVALAMRAMGNEGKALASTLASNVDTFREKAKSLGLGGEEVADGLTRADQATQGYILSVLGIEAPLDGVAAATERANGFIADLVPILESAGFSVERIGQITSTVFDNMVADAQAAAAEMSRAMSAAVIDIRTGIEQAINPSYQMSARDLFAQQGLDTTQYGRLLGLVNAAATGSQAALREVGDRLIYNLDPDGNPATAGYITQAQADAIRSYATSAYSRVVAPQSGGYEPANDNGSSTSSGGGSSDTDSSVRDALNDQIDALRELADIQQDAAREAERMANAFKSAADSLRLYRLGLLTDPSNNPASLGDQLAEAQRQQAAALARVLAGGPDAPDAARELEQVSNTVLSLGRSVFGSSPQYVALFDRTIGMLTQAETASTTFESQQIALATAANAELARLNTQIEALRDQLSSSSSGSPGSPSSPGTPGTPGTPSTPAAGYYTDASGNSVKILFGMQSLGRGANESVTSFMKGFSSYTGPLTEQAANSWMQEQHPSGLTGLSRLEYFAAARQAGYPMNLDFGAGTHTAWLNAVTDGARWLSFINKLEAFTDVPLNFFQQYGAPYQAPAAGTPKQYAFGGLVTGGTPGLDSVPAMLMPGERVFSVPHSRIIEGLALGRGGSNDNREMIQRMDRLIAENARINARLAQIESGQNRGNQTRDEMLADAKAGRAARAPKAGAAPVRTRAA